MALPARPPFLPNVPYHWCRMAASTTCSTAGRASSSQDRSALSKLSRTACPLAGAEKLRLLYTSNVATHSRSRRLGGCKPLCGPTSHGYSSHHFSTDVGTTAPARSHVVRPSPRRHIAVDPLDSIPGIVHSDNAGPSTTIWSRPCSTSAREQSCSKS